MFKTREKAAIFSQILFMAVLCYFVILSTVSATTDNGIIWERKFRPEDFYDSSYNVLEFDITPDGGCIIAGTSSSSLNHQLVVLKLDPKGNEQWKKTYSDTYVSIGTVLSTKEGGYIVTYTYHGLILLKIDTLGNEEWRKKFEELSGFHIPCVIEMSDGGYILTAMTNSFLSDVYACNMIRIDNKSNPIWEKNFVCKSPPRIYTAKNDDFFLYNYPYLIKFEGRGEQLWLLNFNNLDKERDGIAILSFGGSHAQTRDGGFVLALEGNRSGSNTSNILLIKISSEGEEKWRRIFDEPYQTGSSSVIQTSDGGYLIGGTISYGKQIWDSYFVKTDSDGNIIWAFPIKMQGSGGVATSGLKEINSSKTFIASINRGYILINFKGPSIQYNEPVEDKITISPTIRPRTTSTQEVTQKPQTIDKIDYGPTYSMAVTWKETPGFSWISAILVFIIIIIIIRKRE